MGVEVEADGSGCLVVRWELDGDHAIDVDIAIGPTPDAAEHIHVVRVPIHEGSARLTDVPLGRHYVSVSCRGGFLVGAERRVSFRGLTNFRDLGGYPTSSGWTRWGRVFRSESLHNFTIDDLAAFDELGVRAIYDLRHDEEREREPGPRPCRHLAVPSPRVEDFDPSMLRERIDGERWLFEDYRGMLEQAGPVFGALFSALAEPEGTPAVFHCLGGKDRTGLAAALLLSWLGVDRDTVLDDYELSARCGSADRLSAVADIFVAGGIARPAAEGLLSTPAGQWPRRWSFWIPPTAGSSPTSVGQRG